MKFLHALFKSKESKSFLGIGYITGIMPIKKIKNESALIHLGYLGYNAGVVINENVPVILWMTGAVL